MQLHLGNNLETPTIAATLSNEELATLKDKPAFEEPLSQLVAAKNIRIIEHVDALTFEFLLKRIGRRPKASRERYLKPALHLLARLAWLPDEQNSRLTDLEIAAQPILDDGRRGIGATVRWPAEDEGVVSKFATVIMQQTGKQISLYRDQYHNNQALYESNVFAWLERRGRGVTIAAGAGRDARMKTDSALYNSAEPSFALRSHNIYHQQELIVCLAGVIAVANADDLLTGKLSGKI